MEIEITKPTPEAAELQDLFKQTDKEAILCLTKEVEELSAKLRAWEKCADRLIDFAKIIQATEGNSTRNPEYYNRACEVVEEYKKLKEE